MFYSAQILSKKGPLATTWLAAHLERRLGRQQVFETSIPSTIDAIVNPEAPLALRLSGQLLLGLVRIYGRKVVYLEKDCTDAITKLREVHTQQITSTDKQLAPLEAITLPGDVFLSFELFPDDGTDAFEAAEPSRSGRASMGSARDSLLLVDGLSGLSGSQNLLRHEEFDVAGEEVERALMQTPERARYALDARGVRTPELPKGGIGDEAASEPHSTAPPAAADLEDPLVLEEPPVWEQEELNMAPQDMDFELRNEGEEQQEPPGVTGDAERCSVAAADAAATADARRAAAGTAEPSRASRAAERRGVRRRALPMDTEEQELAREEVRALLMNTAPLLRRRVGGSPSPGNGTVGAVLSQLVVAGLENEPLPRLHRAPHAHEPPLAPALLQLLDACHQAAPLRLCALGEDPAGEDVAKVAAAAAGSSQRPRQLQLSGDAAQEQAELQDGAEGGAAALELQGGAQGDAAALEPQDGAVGDAAGLDPQYEMDLPLYDGFDGAELPATPGGDAATPRPTASPAPAERSAAEEPPATPVPAEQGADGAVPRVAADVVSMFRDVDATQLEEEQLDADGAAGVGFSSRTLQVLSHLQNALQAPAAADAAAAPGKRKRSPAPDAASALVQVSRMAAGQNRLDAARCFFEMLVLNAKGYVQLQQAEPYGEIGVIPQSAMPMPSCTAAAQSRSPSSKARRTSSVPSVATTPPALAAIQA